MKKALVFAGTLEGRNIAKYLAGNGIATKVCVATAYGESLFAHVEGVEVLSKRQTTEEMVSLIDDFQPDVVVDATHPYAVVVTENIKGACAESGKEYVRLLRPSKQLDTKKTSTVFVEDVSAAVQYLEQTEGNVFLTTGSKELKAFTNLSNYKERIYARVLSLASVAQEAAEMGIEGKHLICMQGPFSYEINVAMMKQVNAKILVTKESGTVGGFEEKYEAAVALGMQVVIIGRPTEEVGYSFGQCKKNLQEMLQIEPNPQITIVGIGTGNPDVMTVEAKKAIAEAEVVIGAKRMVEAVAIEGQETYGEYLPQKVKEYVKNHAEFENIVLVQSGDIGFYSGAKKLIEIFDGKVKTICGISSPVYFCGKLQIPWSDVHMASVHGRNDNIIGHVKQNEKVFCLVDNEDTVSNICGRLVEYGMGDILVHVGERLSYPDENIISKKASSFVGESTQSLAVMLIVNEDAKGHVVTPGIPDGEFLRDKVPMTKEEIRTISIGKLQLQKDSVVYDIGAGTGSVSIEVATMVTDGKVYAIEKKDTAVALIAQNKKKFGTDNLEIIAGLAPESLVDLPAPTHGFIGGSSGNLKEIIELLLQKNPKVRMVINAITLETVAEVLDCVKTLPVTDVDIASVSVSKSEELGRYHLMRGLNPVYVVSCSGR